MTPEISEMDPRTLEDRTRAWLEANFRLAVSGFVDPSVGMWADDGAPRRMTREHFQEMQRKLRILSWLDRLSFASFIDVASGFDNVPDLVRARYGVPAYYSDLCHAMNLPASLEETGRLDHAVTLRLPALPFPDASFDVVLCSEVLEHLVRPAEAIAELLRITKRYLILTSLEAMSPSRWQQWRFHWRVDVRKPHIERNFFVRSELHALFGEEGLVTENLLAIPYSPASQFAPLDVQERAYGRLLDVDSLVAALCRATSQREIRPDTMGVLIVKRKGDAPPPAAPAHDDEALARWLVAQTAEAERKGIAGLTALGEKRMRPVPLDHPVSPALLARLVCPDCRSPLGRGVAAGVRCGSCGVDFRSERGVPILYANRPHDGADFEAATLDALCGADASRRRVVRRVMRRLRRNEAPAGAVRRKLWELERRLGLADLVVAR